MGGVGSLFLLLFVGTLFSSLIDALFYDSDGSKEYEREEREAQKRRDRYGPDY